MFLSSAQGRRRKGTLLLYGPSPSAEKKFRQDLKAETKKSYSKSFEQWTAKLNPIMRGKYNYMLATAKVWKEVNEVLHRTRKMYEREPGQRSLRKLDAYVRGRLRVNFSNRGKKHGSQRAGNMLKVKFNNIFFVCKMKLVVGDHMIRKIFYGEYSAENYMRLRIAEKKNKKKREPDPKRDEFFQFAYAK